ncbi:MAG: hypothetical protein WAX22_02400 [Lactococcus hircilactis]
MTVITITLLLSFIWFVFDMNMLAWGDVILNIMLGGTVILFTFGLWVGLLSWIFFFILVILVIAFISALLDWIVELLLKEGEKHD